MFGANVCMWVGLILITGIDAAVLVGDGPEPVPMYNPDTYIIFLGAVVVCFEGIGLVLPLRDSMEPDMQVRRSLSFSFRVRVRVRAVALSFVDWNVAA